MRIFLGIFLGAFLTIFGAYMIDSYNAPGRMRLPRRRRVTWSVGTWSTHNWQSFKGRVQSEWTRLSSSLKA